MNENIRDIHTLLELGLITYMQAIRAIDQIENEGTV